MYHKIKSQECKENNYVVKLKKELNICQFTQTILQHVHILNYWLLIGYCLLSLELGWVMALDWGSDRGLLKSNTQNKTL